MITLGQAELQVATNLPPSTGEYRFWDWQTFYNAVLHIMQNPRNQAAYYRAYGLVASLPENMQLTPQVLAAGWARFTQLYPGWEKWDYRTAYDLMHVLLGQTGRLLKGDDRQWWTVEQEWQDMEVPKFAFVARPSTMASVYY